MQWEVLVDHPQYLIRSLRMQKGESFDVPLNMQRAEQLYISNGEIALDTLYKEPAHKRKRDYIAEGAGDIGKRLEGVFIATIHAVSREAHLLHFTYDR